VIDAATLFVSLFEVQDCARRISVKSFGGKYFSGVFIDDERAVVSELTHQAVPDVRVSINIRVRRTHLHASQSSSDGTSTRTLNDTIRQCAES